MIPHITVLYAGLLGVLAVVIAAMAGRARAQAGVSVGDGGNTDLLLAMRRHANFAEWVPITLVLIALLEMNGAPNLAIHIMGAGLVIARIGHAQGLKADTMSGLGRLVGAAGTSLITGVASIWCVVIFFLAA